MSVRGLPGITNRIAQPNNVVYYLVMIKLNIHEAKTHLSKYLARLKPGDAILLCRRNSPIAEIRALRRPQGKSRPLGLAKGRGKIPKSFFNPLPKEIIAQFEGK